MSDGDACKVDDLQQQLDQLQDLVLSLSERNDRLEHRCQVLEYWTFAKFVPVVVAPEDYSESNAPSNLSGLDVNAPPFQPLSNALQGSDLQGAESNQCGI